MVRSWFTRMIGELLNVMDRVGLTRLVFARRPNDLVLFHNRGVLHTVVGTFKPDQVRAFHQCNLAASGDPIGPSAEDVKKWA
jgi:hypothetical protein